MSDEHSKTSDPAVGSTRLVRAWRRLKASETLRSTDRPVRIDGMLEGKIPEGEIGLRMDESGYFGIARMRKHPNARAEARRENPNA